jgi:hypothetical protein
MLRDRTSELDPDQDYIRQQIKKLLQLFAQILTKELDAEKTQQSLQDLHAGAGRILGADYEALERLAPESAAAILRGEERLRAYAAAVAIEGEILYRGSRLEEARRQSTRALALYRELVRLAPDDEEAHAAIQRLESSSV